MRAVLFMCSLLTLAVSVQAQEVMTPPPVATMVSLSGPRFGITALPDGEVRRGWIADDQSPASRKCHLYVLSRDGFRAHGEVAQYSQRLARRDERGVVGQIGLGVLQTQHVAAKQIVDGVVDDSR